MYDVINEAGLGADGRAGLAAGGREVAWGQDSGVAVGLDWAGFEGALVDALVQAVRSAVTEHPGERFYAAVLDGVYRETDGQITLPNLGMNSEPFSS